MYRRALRKGDIRARGREGQIYYFLRGPFRKEDARERARARRGDSDLEEEKGGDLIGKKKNRHAVLGRGRLVKGKEGKEIAIFLRIDLPERRGEK